RHHMAKAAVEAALWDLHARAQGISLAALLGGTRDRVAVGVSLGIEPTVDALLERVEHFLHLGYRRIKIKIKPGWVLEPVEQIRRRFGDIMLQVDANSAFSLDDAPLLRALDDHHLVLIEQPLEEDDIVDHAKLQAQLRTPICLDESIVHARAARAALELGACRVINIKQARVGGLTEAVAIHDLCQARGVPVWCGGMLETGPGRAANLALASLPNFTLPGDISASDRYFQEDLIDPPVVLNADGTITVPTGAGLGVHVVPERVARYAVRHARLAAGGVRV
ncbi:MAG: o-succinylbenzoate synthase, partial [Firmicutes bacterium]|nr:o-succinylbenzoate synthase [Bacillota bacterium]